MTSWTNVGLYTDGDTNEILKVLFENYSNNLVSDNPPTLQYRLNKREREKFAEEFLHNFPIEISHVVFFNNSDTADWGDAWVYHIPDDLRKKAVLHEINGESGLHGADVEKELSDLGFNVSKRHYTSRLDKSDYIELWTEE